MSTEESAFIEHINFNVMDTITQQTIIRLYMQLTQWIFILIKLVDFKSVFSICGKFRAKKIICWREKTIHLQSRQAFSVYGISILMNTFSWSEKREFNSCFFFHQNLIVILDEERNKFRKIHRIMHKKLEILFNEHFFWKIIFPRKMSLLKTENNQSNTCHHAKQAFTYFFEF